MNYRLDFYSNNQGDRPDSKLDRSDRDRTIIAEIVEDRSITNNADRQIESKKPSNSHFRKVTKNTDRNTFMTGRELAIADHFPKGVLLSLRDRSLNVYLFRPSMKF